MSEEKGTALLVEDNLIQAKAAKRILQSMGYAVEHTTTGEEAIEMFKQSNYNFAIFDIGLDGDLSGDEAVTQIRKLEVNKRCPIFAVTAHVSSEAIDRYIAAGIDKVFEKPIIKDKIIEALAEFTS